MLRMPEDAAARKQNLSKYYIYCVIPANGEREFGKIGIGGQGDRVYTIDYKDIAAVVSNTSEEKFDGSDENIFAHQRVVQQVFEKKLGVPLPFATLLESEEELRQLLEERYAEFQDKLSKLNMLNSDGPQDESSQLSAKEIIGEALTNSAANAVKMRQLNEEISQLRSMRYEKTMEAVADAIMQRFSTQLSTVLVSLTQTLERTMEKMESIRHDLSHLDTMSYDNRSQSGVPNIFDDEIRDIREKMRRLSLSSLQYATTEADLSEDHDSRRY
jgi:hypothetical protein